MSERLGFRVYTTKVDNTKYIDFYKKHMKHRREEGKKILAGAASTFAQWASVYVPPVMGSKEIPDDYYYRKLIYLPRFVKRDYRAKEKQADITALKNGYKFKVRHWLNRRKYQDKYFRHVTQEARAYLRIIYRGLLRVSFAMDLVSIGEKYPSNIKKLLKKSPKLQKFKKFNKIYFSDDDEKITIINNSYQAFSGDTFAQIAVRRANERAEKYIKNKYRALMKADIKF